MSSATTTGSIPALEPNPSLDALFKSAQTKISATSLGSERWYILVLACLTASPDPESAANLYTHLCSQEGFQTPESRQSLVRRLREALMMSTSLVGVPKTLASLFAIARHEKPEDRDYSVTRQGWQPDEANLQRAKQWFGRVYTRDEKSTLNLFEAHKDFEWLSLHITYGFYLSNREVLDDYEAELITLAAIMSQNQSGTTFWHIRGARRIGMSKEDVQAVWDVVKMIADHFGVKLDRVPTVDEVESDVV